MGKKGTSFLWLLLYFIQTDSEIHFSLVLSHVEGLILNLYILMH